jgi:hypothetical protein
VPLQKSCAEEIEASSPKPKIDKVGLNIKESPMHSDENARVTPRILQGLMKFVKHLSPCRHFYLLAGFLTSLLGVCSGLAYLRHLDP